MVPTKFGDKNSTKHNIEQLIEALYITLTQVKKNKNGFDSSVFWDVYWPIASERQKQKISDVEKEKFSYIQHSVGTMKSLDKYFLDDQIKKLLCFAFGKHSYDDISDNKEILKFGWRKYSE